MVMNEFDFNSEGSGRVVVSTLLSTLGITRSRIIAILRHFSYDGVYATKEQRTSGGGSLNLVNSVCRELGIEGSMTGSWDMAHLMEVSFLISQILTDAATNIALKAFGLFRGFL